MLSKEFVTGGRAVFTCESDGFWHTYRVKFKAGEGQFKDAYFVSVLTGGDQYTYVGMMNPDTGKCVPTRKSSFQSDSTAVRLFNAATQVIWTGQGMLGMQIRHEGKCGRCGRALTHPDSLDTGIGPECARRENRAKAAAPNIVEVPARSSVATVSQVVAECGVARGEYLKVLHSKWCLLRDMLRDGPNGEAEAAMAVIQDKILAAGGELP